jgi:hypothetical protein
VPPVGTLTIQVAAMFTELFLAIRRLTPLTEDRHARRFGRRCIVSRLGLVQLKSVGIVEGPVANVAVQRGVVDIRMVSGVVLELGARLERFWAHGTVVDRRGRLASLTSPHGR